MTIRTPILLRALAVVFTVGVSAFGIFLLWEGPFARSPLKWPLLVLLVLYVVLSINQLGAVIETDRAGFFVKHGYLGPSRRFEWKEMSELKLRWNGPFTTIVFDGKPASAPPPGVFWRVWTWWLKRWHGYEQVIVPGYFGRRGRTLLRMLNRARASGQDTSQSFEQARSQARPSS